DPRNDGVGHFAWIKDLSRLVSMQLTGKKNKKYFCDRCLHYFGSSEKLQTHEVDCQKINTQKFSASRQRCYIRQRAHGSAV
ncbi:hypothetical protein ALC57_10677, partial [Trachymyrmex cornetzi]